MDLGEKLKGLIEKRTCLTCGAVFKRIPAGNGKEEVTTLQQFADHQIVHQPTPEQWHTAYKKIEAIRNRSRSASI